MTSDARFPLHWPEGWPRCTAPRRGLLCEAPYAYLCNDTIQNLRALGATGIVLSSNVPLRSDGLPRDGVTPKDPGAALHFRRAGRSYALACDVYRTPRANMRALWAASESLVTISHFGGGLMLAHAFLGYLEVPAPNPDRRPPWWETLGVKPNATTDKIKAAYKRLALEKHPDTGGSADEFQELQDAYKRATGV